MPPQDHVDRVRTQWSRERPDLDTQPIAVIARLGRAAHHVDQALSELFDRYGLSRADWDVLASLRREVAAAGAPRGSRPARPHPRCGGPARRRRHVDKAGTQAGRRDLRRAPRERTEAPGAPLEEGAGRARRPVEEIARRL